VIRRGSAPVPRPPGDAVSCRSVCNGEWGAHGMTGAVGCLCRTPDGGTPCQSPLDCAAECLIIPRDDRYEGVRCGPAGCNGPVIQGECAWTYASFGCHGRVVELSTPEGPVREVHTICVD
jgi:hypothetical protein